MAAGAEDRECLVRARVMYFHQVGYYALALRESLAERIDLAPYCFEVVAGEPAPADFAATLAGIVEKVLRRLPKHRLGGANAT